MQPCRGCCLPRFRPCVAPAARAQAIIPSLAEVRQAMPQCSDIPISTVLPVLWTDKLDTARILGGHCPLSIRSDVSRSQNMHGAIVFAAKVRLIFFCHLLQENVEKVLVYLVVADMVKASAALFVRRKGRSSENCCSCTMIFIIRALTRTFSITDCPNRP